MIIRRDRRTPAPILKEIDGISLCNSGKYLGIEIDDSLNFHAEL